MKNLMQKINSTRSKINRYYNMDVSQCLEIFKKSEDDYSLIVNGFVFGYMQGTKALKAEMRKNKAVISHD